MSGGVMATADDASVNVVASNATVAIGRLAGAAAVSVSLALPLFETATPTGRLIIKPEDRTYAVPAESRTKIASQL